MLTATFLAIALIAPAQDQPVEPLFQGTGAHARTVSTQNRQAQAYFNQGLAFLFAFNHDESLKSFREAAKLDPGCAMAWWGIATANGPHINNPSVDPDHAKEAWDALQTANKARATQIEKDLVAAAMVRFSAKPDADRTQLDKAYADAMRKLALKYPKDADIGAMAAEAAMDLHPWDLWKGDGSPQPWTPAIRKELERLMKMSPDHPMALHLYIHTVEASPRPQDALAAAKKLWHMEPALGHMVHMPSHIFVRTGMWEQAIQANEEAIAADDAYFKVHPRQGFYLFYMAHNHQMLAYAAMMRGQSQLAIDGMDHMGKLVPMEVQEMFAPIIDGYLAAIYEVRIRFGKWDEILSLPEPNAHFPVMRAMRHMARSVAWAAKGDAANARLEQAMFYASRTKVPAGYTIGNNSAMTVLKVAENLMNAEILLGEKKLELALPRFRQAVVAEDQVKYNEPPDWLQPTRHALGALLVQMGRYAEAEKVYREDLRRIPSNGWSLFGLAATLHGLGEHEEAMKTDAMFKSVWSKADMQIGSSCLCVK